MSKKQGTRVTTDIEMLIIIILIMLSINGNKSKLVYVVGSQDTVRYLSLKLYR